MKEIAKIWWPISLALLGIANIMLFVWMMLMLGFWGRDSVRPLIHLFMWSFWFSYYCATPIAVFGFMCAIGCAAAKQAQRAALLAALSGGALFCGIMVWSFFHL